jgi:hypothetical protein
VVIANAITLVLSAIVLVLKIQQNLSNKPWKDSYFIWQFAVAKLLASNRHPVP